MFDDAFKTPNACRETVPRDSDGMMSTVRENGAAVVDVPDERFETCEIPARSTISQRYMSRVLSNALRVDECNELHLPNVACYRERYS